MFDIDLAGRVLPFDAVAADRYSNIVVGRRLSGKPIDVFDAFIAAIAWVVAAPVATRDIGGFEDCGLELIDPWRHDV